MSGTLRLIRWWVRAYTAGLPAAARERRRTEIESDMWEQMTDRSPATDPEFGRRSVQLALVDRWLRGIPDDLLWRMEQRRTSTAARTRRWRIPMLNLRVDRLSAVPLVVVAVAIVTAVALVVVDNIQYFEQSQRLVATSTLATLSAVLLVGGLVSTPLGFMFMRTSPAGGAALAAGGAIVAGVVTYWLIVPPVAAAVVSFVAVRRARRLAAERRDGTPSLS